MLHIEVWDPVASTPDPANGAIGITLPILTWKAGDGAALHNVYFGTSKDLTAADLVASNSPAPVYFHVAGVEPGTTYYWRVDEIDAAGVVSTGPVWSFAAASLKAFNGLPKNGAKYVAGDVKLTWTPGYMAVSHTVYFGTSFADVNNASGGKPQADATYTPAGPLANGMTYYWRVDETDAQKTYKGDVWSFSTMPVFTITNPDLVGWWTFDEGTGNTALDFSGHGNDGTFGGGVTRVAGIMDGAVALNSGYVAVNGVVNDIKSTNITLSAWIKTTQSGEGNVFAANDSASGHPLMFGISGGNAYVYDGSARRSRPRWSMTISGT